MELRKLMSLKREKKKKSPENISKERERESECQSDIDRSIVSSISC